MVVGESKRTANIMDGIENTGDVRLHDHRLRLKQRFDIVRKLGQGTYGKVQLGINKKTGQEVAIKTIKKCKIESEADLIRIRREVQIMSSVRHPNIVHIYEVFENSEKMILVMEYCSGGELYDYLSQKKVLQEEEARRLFRQIATAVYYCHIHKICHRDLKLENVLLDDTGSAKIADFGLSNVFKETSLLSTFCGSPLYASPEIVKGTPYIGPEVDCWSLGVLLYTLVYGAMPFDGSNFKRLVRQISNGDYYEPKTPSTASPLIRDMLTVEPLKRADIVYICDHPWVNTGCETGCLEMAEALAAETPVRLDLLLSLAPAAPSNSNSVVVPPGTDLGPEESNTDLTSSTSMAVEPSNSAEKRILELVAEGGEDAIKPSPTRTIVSAGDNKRKLELAMSASGLHRKKDRIGSCASIAPPAPLPEDAPLEMPTLQQNVVTEATIQPSLKSSATITIAPAPAELVKDQTREIIKEPPKDEGKDKPTGKPRLIIKKKASPPKTTDEKASPEKQEESKEEAKPTSVASAADKLTSLNLAQQAAANQTLTKPKKLSIPGGNVGNFKEQFERRASLTSAPEVKRTLSKPVVSKIAKPKAQSEDRELPAKSPDNGTVRLQQIGIEPTQSPTEDSLSRSGVKKTESEPTHSTTSVDPSVLLQDARRSLQNSMAKLVEEKAGEEGRRRAARDIISSAIRTGKPPMPYGRSSSAGVTSLSSPPGTPPAPPSAPVAGPSSPARLFRTEAQHRVEDHRNRGVSVERIIPIHVAEESPVQNKPSPPASAAPVSPGTPITPGTPTAARANVAPVRRMLSSESSSGGGGAEGSPGEPIKKSAREFIIPIAVEGKGYVTPRQRSLEPEATARLARSTITTAGSHAKPRRISSLVSGGESEEEDDTHMHRLRSSRAARAESVSSGEEDEEDEGFHLLTAENLFSTLLHRVRALTNRLNGEEGPGFPQHSLFNNLQSPFFNSPHLPRRHLLREGWGSRDLHADLDSMFKPRTSLPRGNTKKSGKHQTKPQPNAEPNVESGLDLSDLDLSSIQFSEKELRALSGLTPALSRRLQRQLLAHLPPAAARSLRRTLSLHSTLGPSNAASANQTAHTAPGTPAASDTGGTSDTATPTLLAETVETQQAAQQKQPELQISPNQMQQNINESSKEDFDVSVPHFSTLPRLRRHSTVSRESTPLNLAQADTGYETPKIGSLAKELNHSRGSSIRSTPDRPLLSKYLTPDRNISVDESYSSDSGSILSEPSYIAAYGTPGLSTLSGLGFRRHSMRLAGEQPKKRISRFLRPDFYDTPVEESIYAKHKKEKELETQKILKEIRDKRNRSLDSSLKSPTESGDAQQMFKDDALQSRKCLSPIAILTAKERSRSNTPFFPILDNIKETITDTSFKKSGTNPNTENNTCMEDISSYQNSRESKLGRPKSYPIKNTDSLKSHNLNTAIASEKESESKVVQKESKLVRPKSYPTSSPSPEKVYLNRSLKKNEVKCALQDEAKIQEVNNDIAVSFNISLPRKKTDALNDSESVDKDTNELTNKNESSDNILTVNKSSTINTSRNDHSDLSKDQKLEKGSATIRSATIDNSIETVGDESVKNVINHGSEKEDIKLKSLEKELVEKKGTIKKKIIKKVSSKSKTDVGSNLETSESKPSGEKKKVTKKLNKKASDDDSKTTTTVKKKSVLQSIGHKLEKFASTKSSSPEKVTESNSTSVDNKKELCKLNLTQRELSVPPNGEPPTESNLIKRAVTLTDVAALEDHSIVPNKTTVSKVLGLFKKFDPKEKKSSTERTQNENNESINETISESLEKSKPKRPTSLLLNGLGRKHKYGRTASDSASIASNDNDDISTKKDAETKNLRNSLKLDFSRLPRVKKIVPTNPVIEPQVMGISVSKETETKDLERNRQFSEGDIDAVDPASRSRSRSRSSFSNSELKSDLSDVKERRALSPERTVHHPVRNHEPTTPEREDVVDRIRRKSFYTRFNEKKQRRKSSLVGPGATEYDPVARIHSQSANTKCDVSPTSPGTYDLSPGYSVASDLSPSTERYCSLLADSPVANRTNARFDQYGLNDKIGTYRSLDRSEFKKYPGSRSYLDYYDQPLYGTHRYSRTKSLLDSSDVTDVHSLGNFRDPHKYNRTISMYSPGNYATYRPKRTRNSAIILKESEKEPSPENILDKIRQRKKLSVGVNRKPEFEKDSLLRPNVPSKSKGDGAECSEKTD